MAQVQLRLLGALQIEQNGKSETQFRSRRAIALLVYLIANDRPIPRSELVELIWPDKTEKQGRGNLRWALTYLSKILPEALDRTRHTVHFAPPATYNVDVRQISAALSQSDWQQLGDLLLAMQGTFLDGFYFDESAEFETWLITQRETWRLRILDALETLIARHNSLTEHELALRFAEKWLDIEPWAENAHRWSMQLLARLGRLDAALEQYERCWRILAEELGTEPTDETTDLFQRLQQSAEQPSHNLPAQPTQFVGRATDINALLQLMHDANNRVVTLVGPGGMGKTRLAIAAAEQLVGSFIDGVTFVDLSQIDSDKDIAASVLAALEQSGTIAQTEGSPTSVRRLHQTLSDKELLLILDNFEHVINGATELVDILHAAPRVKLIVTSRERLNIRWERLHVVEGLPDLAAFDLFVQAAQHARPSFVVNQNNRASIRKICQLVDGMPLGLELASAWTRMQTCPQIVAMVESDLSSLTSTQRDVPDRHRSMRAVFASSWRLLPVDEQQRLGQLAIFVGGFSAEAAQQVAAASWGALAPLVDKSLLGQTLSVEATGTQVRYKMHELLRQFSAETLTSALTTNTRHQHAAYFTDFLAARSLATQQGNKRALDQIETELANVKQAWRWSIEQQQVASLAKAATPLAYFYDMRSRSQEAVQAFEPLIAMLSALPENGDVLPQVTLAAAKLSLGNAYTRVFQHTEAEQMLREGLTFFEMVGHQEGQIFALFALARVLSYQHKLAEAQTLYKQSYALAKEIDDLVGMARAAVNLSDIAYRHEEWDEGRRLSAESHTLFKQFGDHRGIAVALLNIGRGHLANSDIATARTFVTDSHAIAEDIGAVSVLANTCNVLGEIALLEQAWDSAETHFKSAMLHFDNIGSDDDVSATQKALQRLELARSGITAANA